MSLPDNFHRTLSLQTLDHSTDGSFFNPSPVLEACTEYTIAIYGVTEQGTVSIDKECYQVDTIFEGEEDRLWLLAKDCHIACQQ